ncbi:MAG: SPOR domain-containing protein [Rhodanobacter sp.]|nr:MAG: SPOR domain-containing protein [Rhodanobacter sp.]
MFLRLLFVLLIALNLVVGVWLWLGQPYAHGVKATDPGVAELRLLSELPGAATSVSTAAQAQLSGRNNAAGERCLTLGPFATPQDLRLARQALLHQTLRMRSRQEQTRQTTSWWVYLPAAASRAKALAQARELDRKQISDYFVVSTGDQSNTISLGLFKDPANARKRRDELVTAGFPAQISERTEDVPEYWLDLVEAGTDRLGWRQRIHDAGVGAHDSHCF